MPKGKKKAEQKQFVNKILIDPNELMSSSSSFDGLREDFKLEEETGFWVPKTEWKAPDNFIETVNSKNPEEKNDGPNELNRRTRGGDFFDQKQSFKNILLSKKRKLESSSLENNESDTQKLTYENVEKQINKETSNTVTQEQSKFILALNLQATNYLKKNAKTLGFHLFFRHVIKACYEKGLLKLVKGQELATKSDIPFYLSIDGKGKNIIFSLQQCIVFTEDEQNKIAVFTFKYFLDKKEQKIKILPAEIEFDVTKTQLEPDEIVAEDKNIKVELIIESEIELKKKIKNFTYLNDNLQAKLKNKSPKDTLLNYQDLKKLVINIGFGKFLSAQDLKNLQQDAALDLVKAVSKFVRKKSANIEDLQYANSILASLDDILDESIPPNKLVNAISNFVSEKIKNIDKSEFKKILFLGDLTKIVGKSMASQESIKAISDFVKKTEEDTSNLEHTKTFLTELKAILNGTVAQKDKGEKIKNFIDLAESCKANELTGYMLKISAILFIGVGTSLMIGGGLTFEPITFTLGLICLSIGISEYLAAIAAHNNAKIGKTDFFSRMSFFCETNPIASSMSFFATTTAAIEAKKQITVKSNSEVAKQEEYAQIPSEEPKIERQEEGFSTYTLHNQ